MQTPVTHFEIYGPRPEQLARFYQQIFDWQVEKMEGLGYWRISAVNTDSSALHGGLTFRSIPDLSGFMLYVNVPSLDKTVEKIISLGGSIVRAKTAVPKTAWVTIVSDPDKNIFGIWEADATAFPMPHPD